MQFDSVYEMVLHFVFMYLLLLVPFHFIVWGVSLIHLMKLFNRK